MDRLSRRLAVITLLGWLAGCASPAAPPAPPPPPTVVELSLATAPGANPDPSGRPSPVVVVIYQLAQPATFQRAEFLDLYRNDKGFLGGDLLDRVQLELAPGQTQALHISGKTGLEGIGVVAFFRDYQSASWRDYLGAPANRTTKIEASIGPLAVSLRATGN